MHKVHLIDSTASRNYLLSKAQHMVGGFGKYPGDPPGINPLSFSFSPLFYFIFGPRNLANENKTHNKDILHSYLGLAALAAMRESELRTIDPMLCISVSARDGFLERRAGAA